MHRFFETLRGSMVQKALQYAVLGILFITCAKLCVDLVSVLVIETRALNGDALIYLSVGRGILNGLHPYVDLFESKPPGIFYLNALSLWLSQGTGLLRLLQDINLLCLPFALALFAWLQVRGHTMRAALFVLVAFAFGSLLAIGAEEMAGGLQSEMFALVPVVAYVLTISGKMSVRRMFLAGVCVFGAVVIREPFLFGLLAAALLLSRTKGEFLRSFIVPCCVAAALLALFLVAAGILSPYVNPYLGAMLGSRIQRNDLGPLYLRALWVYRMYGAFTTYSTMPLLGFVIISLWLYAIVVKNTLSVSLRWLLALAAALGVIGMHFLFVLFTLFYKAAPLGLSPWAVLTDQSFWLISLMYLLGAVAYAALLGVLGWKAPKAVAALASGLIAVMLVNLAIGIGGYLWQYMIFAFPPILACFVLLLKQRNVAVCMVIGLVLAVATLQCEPRLDPGYVTLAPQAVEDSRNLDAFMKSCGFHTYVFAGGLPMFAFSRYSPIGPIFTLYLHDYLGYSSPLYEQTFENIQSKGQVLIEQSQLYQSKPIPLPKQILQMFAPGSGTCKATIPGYVVLFRKRNA